MTKLKNKKIIKRKKNKVNIKGRKLIIRNKFTLKGRRIIKKAIKKDVVTKKKLSERRRFNFIMNIIVRLNILFIIACCLFYGTRLIYFYKIEHPSMKGITSIMDVLNIKGNVTTVGEGLYKTDNGYVFKGMNVDNYVKYSGRIWRIVSIDENDIVKLITDDSQTSLVWGVDMDYENSYIRSWLNDSDKDVKSFLSGLNNPNIVGYTNTCVDVIDESNKISCESIITDRIGLLSAYEYNEAGGDKSYLNIGQYWWLSNIDNEKVPYYVYSKGSVNNSSYSGATYYSYGVRPVISIAGTTTVLSGNGTKEDPINLDEPTEKVLGKKTIGNYITYSGYTWRIIDIEEDAVKVVMDGYIKDMDSYIVTSFGSTNYCSKNKGMCGYLNSTFYETLENKDYIVEHEYYTGRYDKTINYDYNKVTENKEMLSIGLLQLGELFVNDGYNYFLGSRSITSENNIYEVLKDGIIYAGELNESYRIRPTLYLKSDLTIVSGLGTKKRPFVIG